MIVDFYSHRFLALSEEKMPTERMQLSLAIVAMISGWRPARKATKIDVIQALRQEL